MWGVAWSCLDLTSCPAEMRKRLDYAGETSTNDEAHVRSLTCHGSSKSVSLATAHESIFTLSVLYLRLDSYFKLQAQNMKFDIL